MTSSTLEQRIEFDFGNDQDDLSMVKEAVFFGVKIERVLKAMGKIQFPLKAIDFIYEEQFVSMLRERYTQVLAQASDSGEERYVTLDLSTDKAPLLFRAEIANAYFEHRLATHLSTLNTVEIYFPEHYRVEIAKPIGHEIREYLKMKGIDPERIEQLIACLERNPDLYETIIEGTPSLDIGKKGADKAKRGATAAEPDEKADGQKKQGTELALADQLRLEALSVGGTEAILQDFINRGLLAGMPKSTAETARHYDTLRRIFQKEGELMETGDYNCYLMDGKDYAKLAPRAKWIVNDIIFKNLKEAETIRTVMDLYPKEIPSFLLTMSIMEGVFTGSTGVKIVGRGNKTRYVFDNDRNEDLAAVALGANNLLMQLYKIMQYCNAKAEQFQEGRNEEGINEENRQSGCGSETEPRKKAEIQKGGPIPLFLDLKALRYPSTGLFGLLANSHAHPAGSGCDAMLENSEVRTFYDLMEAKDESQRKKIYNAFRRLHGNVVLVQGDDPRAGYVMRLNEDGRLMFTGVDYYEASMDVRLRGKQCFEAMETGSELIAYARTDESFLRYEFNKIVEPLIRSLETEIEQNQRITQFAAIETHGSPKVMVEAELLRFILEAKRGAYERLSEIGDTLRVGMQFMLHDAKHYMAILGIEKLEDETQVKAAYKRRVFDGKNHPDKTTDPIEMLRRAEAFRTLTNAKNELLHVLKAGTTNATQSNTAVCSYVGKLSEMLK